MARKTPGLSLQDRTTFVYRSFGTRGELIYVGISQSWVHRLRGHEKRSAWWVYVHHVEIQEFADRVGAFAMESWAIRHEIPLANTELQRKHCPPEPPTPVRSFGHIVRRFTFFTDQEIPPKEVTLAHSEYQTGVLAV